MKNIVTMLLLGAISTTEAIQLHQKNLMELAEDAPKPTALAQAQQKSKEASEKAAASKKKVEELKAK